MTITLATITITTTITITLTTITITTTTSTITTTTSATTMSCAQGPQSLPTASWPHETPPGAEVHLLNHSMSIASVSIIDKASHLDVREAHGCARPSASEAPRHPAIALTARRLKMQNQIVVVINIKCK